MPAAYIAARHGAAPVYPHPDLEPALRDTYGVAIWHEQLIMMISTMAGCDYALAEEARRALGDRDRMPRVRAWFERDAAARGYDPASVARVWHILESHGAYGFCRAHATAFAVPALQSAWLKAHYPAALYAGLLQHDPGMWPRRVIIADARRHRVPILPIDVNRSRPDYRIEPVEPGRFGLRMALSGVRGITDEQAEQIAAGQPYSSLRDLWERARPPRPVLENLIEVGALDSVRGRLNRRDLLLAAGELHQLARDRRAAHGQLAVQEPGAEQGAPSGLPEMTGREALAAELHVLGADVTEHLMVHHHQLLRELGATDAKHLAETPAGRPVLVAGVRSATQTPPLASGKRIIFATLDDGSGLVDLVFFEDSQPRCAHTVFHSTLLLVRGVVQRRGPRASVVAHMCWDLAELAAVRRDQGPEAAALLLTGRSRHATAHGAQATRPPTALGRPVSRQVLTSSSPGSAG
jgi:error-prone DNA polymerase